VGKDDYAWNSLLRKRFREGKKQHEEEKKPKNFGLKMESLSTFDEQRLRDVKFAKKYQDTKRKVREGIRS